MLFNLTRWRRRTIALVLCAGSLIPFYSSFGQEPSRKPVTVEIEKKDATILKGTLVRIARDTARFIDENNTEWKIPLEEIRNIEYVDASPNARRWFDPPNTMRYFLVTTAIPMRKKELAFQATYLFFVSAHYGLSNRISIGAGTDVLTRSTYFLNAKLNLIKGTNFKLSGNVNYYQLTPDYIDNVSNKEIRGLSMLSGAGTWGNENHNLTLGAGYIYTAGGFLPPIITLSGTTRFSKRFAVVTENWFFFDDDAYTNVPVLFSFGLRYISKRNSIDLGFYSDSEFSLEAGFPYIGYTFAIKKD